MKKQPKVAIIICTYNQKILLEKCLLSLKSNVLRLIRAIPYLYGYYTGKNKKIPGL